MQLPGHRRHLLAAGRPLVDFRSDQLDVVQKDHVKAICLADVLDGGSRHAGCLHHRQAPARHVGRFLREGPPVVLGQSAGFNPVKVDLHHGCHEPVPDLGLVRLQTEKTDPVILRHPVGHLQGQRRLSVAGVAADDDHVSRFRVSPALEKVQTVVDVHRGRGVRVLRLAEVLGHLRHGPCLHAGPLA